MFLQDSVLFMTRFRLVSLYRCYVNIVNMFKDKPKTRINKAFVFKQWPIFMVGNFNEVNISFKE